MEMNLVKENIKTGEVVCQKYSQTMAESDVIVPDTKPDIQKILEVSGTVCITKKMLQQDKAFIQGIIKMNVLYLPEDDENGRIRSLCADLEFNHSLDCRGAAADMQLFAEAVPESFDATLINGRRLNLRCVLGISVKVVRPMLLSLTTGVENADDIALKKERFRFISDTDGCECQIILRDQLALPAGKPAIGEILKVTAVPAGTELCLMENKAVAKGQVRIATLYNSEEDHSLQFMEHTLPFTEILDVDGAAEGMQGDADYHLSDMYYEIRDDADGEARNLGIELVLCVNVRGSEITEIDAVTDAYSLNSGLDLTTKSYHIEQLLDHSSAEISHKDQAQLPPMLPRLKQVCDVSANAKIDRVLAENGQVTVFGTVHTNILYLTTDESTPVCGFHHVSEFSQSFAVDGAGRDTACDAQVFLNHVSYTLSGDDSLELRFVLGLHLKSLKTGETVLVDTMAPFALEENTRPFGIVLYFVQKGDSLWNIAKTYHTTVEEIKTQNQLESDVIHPGQQLKMMAKCAG